MAPALNLVDDVRPGPQRDAFTLLEALEERAPQPGAARVGLTGAPGAGKSTLLDALVRSLRARHETVGIVAVDPSSRRTGGALLGDRVRVRSGATDRGVFFRSMAARNALGGLADGTRASVTVLATVFDRVFVETVGVGQSESDVAMVCDTLVYVAQPAAGDVLQFMKAGVLELPDVFVVNKSDLGAVAERTASELDAGLGLGERAAQDWTPPVVLTSARDGQGIERLIEVLDAHRAHLEQTGGLATRRRAADLAFVRTSLERRYGSYGLARLGNGFERRLAEDAESGTGSAFARVRRLGAEIEEALRKVD